MVLSDMVVPGTCRAQSKGQGHWSPWSSAASGIWVAEDHPKHDQKSGFNMVLTNNKLEDVCRSMANLWSERRGKKL
jgi:hypothetical protein